MGDMPWFEDDATEADLDLDLSGAEGIPSDDKKPKAPKSGKNLDPEKVEEKVKRKKKKATSYSKDDIGNAERLLDEYGAEMRWDESVDEWVIWRPDLKRWEVDSHEAMRRAMSIPRKILRDAGEILFHNPDDKAALKLEAWGNNCGSIGRLRAMLDVAKSLPDMSVSGGEWNADRRLVAAPNGTIELRKSGGIFRESRKEDLTTKVTGCDYDPDAVSPMFEDFLDKFLPEPELRHWAQKVAGYSILGGNPKLRIVFALGPTSSGKSTFSELVKAAMGQYAGPFNLSMLRENQDERPRPDLVTAMDQRVIFASEASSDWHLHADMIKRATGNEEMLARLPHSGVGVRKLPAFTPWIITNNIPTINGADQALYRRLCTVLFPHSIEDDKENEDFKADLIQRGELPGVLAWLVQGWNAYCEEGLSDPPHRVATAEMRMREQFSDLDVFLAECCDTGAEYREVPSDLFASYEEWADMNGIKGRERLTATSFGRALTGRGFAPKKIKENSKPVNRRLGLRLKGR